MSTPPPFRPAPDAAVCVALSGGMDSMALLHALAARADVRARGLRALHVDHGLQAASADWARRCGSACAGLGLACAEAMLHGP